jgi:16S rRNA (adenine1518-N6/adenine1519-N6)-dimethyltransferase
LEIGPGKGALTLPLLARLAKEPKTNIELVTLVERDEKLAEFWKKHATPIKLMVAAADFLQLSESQWVLKPPIAVISNLPYSSGTAILKHLVKQKESIPVMVLMFQAEVARRLRAEAGTKERGSLSVWIQNLWDIEKSLSVSPKCFSPPPKVNSEVVILRRRESPRIKGSVEQETRWESLLRASFAHRRKMLRSSSNQGSMVESGQKLSSGMSGKVFLKH